MTTVTSMSPSQISGNSPAISGNSPANSASHAQGKATKVENFLALLSQALSDDSLAGGGQLLQQLLQKQGNKAGDQQTLPALDPADLSELSDLSAQLNQTLAGVLAGNAPASHSLHQGRSNGKAAGSHNDTSASAESLAAINALLAMLPEQLPAATTVTAASQPLSPGAPAATQMQRALLSAQQQPASSLAASSDTELPIMPVSNALSATDGTLISAASASATLAADSASPLAANAASNSNANSNINNNSNSKNSKKLADNNHNAQLAMAKTNPGSIADLLRTAQEMLLPAHQPQSAGDNNSASQHLVALATSNTGSSQPSAGQQAAAAPLHSASIFSPAGSLLNNSQWQQAISQQIALFTRQGQHRAELRLHPAELGSVKISIKLDDNNLAQLQMLSPHSHVRAALEAALPMLRAQLAESGIQLGQSHIGNESFAGQHFAGQQFPGQSSGQSSAQHSSTAAVAPATDNDVPLATPASLSALSASSAVDTFV